MALEQHGPRQVVTLLRFEPKHATQKAVPPLRKFPFNRRVVDSRNDVHRYTISGGKVYFQYLFNARGSDL